MATNDDLREGKKLLEELNALRKKLNQTPLRLTDEETTRQLRSMPDDIERAKKALSDMEGSATNLYDRLRGVTSELKGQETATSGIRKAFRSLTSDVEKLKFDEQEITKLSSTELQNLQKRVKENKDRINSSAKELINSNRLASSLNSIVESKRAQGEEEDKIQATVFAHLQRIQTLTEEQKAMLAAYFDQSTILNDINKKVEDRLKLEKEIEKATRGFSALADLTAAIPGLRKLSGPFKEAEAAAKKAFEATEDGAKANAAGIKALGNAFKSPLMQLGLLASLFKSILDIAFQVDSQIVEIGKSQGKSYKEASAYRAELQDAADSSYNVLQTTKSLLNAQQELSKAAGVTAGFKVKELQDQVRLTKQVGLQAEDSAKLGTLARINGQTADDILDSTVAQTTALKLSNGVTLDNREVLSDIAKTSGQIAANYANNPKLIGQAVIKARSLGLTLAQAGQMSKGMLDMESSITNEMEAELLIGRELNLDKAKMLSLQGKTAEAAEEMLKQVGSLEDFQKLNVIQQNALAKAVNMTSDELADSLVQQSNLNKLGAVAKADIMKRRDELLKEGKVAEANALVSQATNEVEAKAALDRISAQEKFNAAVDKAKDLFVGLIDNMPILLGILGSIAGVMASIAISAVIASGGAAAIGAAVGLAALGIGGAMAGVAIGKSLEGPEPTGAESSPAKKETSSTNQNYSTMQDGVINPTGGLEVKSPKGSIYLDKNDSVVAGTALNTPKQNTTNKTEEILKKILVAIEKGGDVYMDGNKVGKALVLSQTKLS